MATIVTEVNKGVNRYLKKTKGLLAAGSLGLDCHRTVSPHPSRVRTSSFARQPRTALRLSGANLSLSLRDGHLRWGRRSRETRHCMEQTLAGCSPLHGADARGMLAPLRGADARGTLAPLRGADARGTLAPLRGADARGTLALASFLLEVGVVDWTDVLLPTHSAEKRGMDGAHSFMGERTLARDICPISIVRR
jgi:hypothetical protein